MPTQYVVCQLNNTFSVTSCLGLGVSLCLSKTSHTHTRQQPHHSSMLHNCKHEHQNVWSVFASKNKGDEAVSLRAVNSTNATSSSIKHLSSLSSAQRVPACSILPLQLVRNTDLSLHDFQPQCVRPFFSQVYLGFPCFVAHARRKFDEK